MSDARLKSASCGWLPWPRSSDSRPLRPTVPGCLASKARPLGRRKGSHESTRHQARGQEARKYGPSGNERFWPTSAAKRGACKRRSANDGACLGQMFRMIEQSREAFEDIVSNASNCKV